MRRRCWRRLRAPRYWGRASGRVEPPLARHQDMARQIPKARLAIFENCGHMAPVEAPAAVSDALRDWLQAA